MQALHSNVYVCYTYSCNLTCDHCDIRKLPYSWNQDKFISRLKQFSIDDSVTIFGGEPFLYKDRLKICLETEIITALSTNLLLLDDEILGMLNEFNIVPTTSWNSFRFTPTQYQLWLSNLSKIKDKTWVLITMTPDLLEYNIHNILNDIEATKGCNTIFFEPLLGSTPELIDRFDDWLCNLKWPYTMRNLIEEKMNRWCHKCHDIVTLMPSGDVKEGCPSDVPINYMRIECLDCKYNKVCEPCPKQVNCVFYPKYYEKSKNETRKFL